MTTFHSNIICIYREKGKVWLAELPELCRKNLWITVESDPI